MAVFHGPCPFKSLGSEEPNSSQTKRLPLLYRTHRLKKSYSYGLLIFSSEGTGSYPRFSCYSISLCNLLSSCPIFLRFVGTSISVDRFINAELDESCQIKCTNEQGLFYSFLLGWAIMGIPVVWYCLWGSRVLQIDLRTKKVRGPPFFFSPLSIWVTPIPAQRYLSFHSPDLHACLLL